MLYPSHLFRNHFYDKYNVRVVTQPTGEQLTVDEVRDHLRLIVYESPPTFNEESAWITTFISVAREWCEWWTGCALATQTMELGIAMFPAIFAQWGHRQPVIPYPYTWDNGIMLPMTPPLQSVVSVIYDDNTNTPQTLDPSAYYVDDYQKPATLYPAPGTTWPVAQWLNRRAVRIRYTCGYTLPTDSPNSNPIPFSVKAAMLLVIGHLHENRENSQEVKPEEIPLGAQSLLSRYRVRHGMA